MPPLRLAVRAGAVTNGPSLDPVHLADEPAGGTLVVRAAVAALDELVVRLVRARIALRELAPVISPLEAAFLALTEQPEDDR